MLRLPWSSRTSYAAAAWSATTPTSPVDPAVVDRALANAVRAPSAGFSQGWAFLVLDTPDDVRRFWAATADDLDAPRQLAGRDDARAGGDPAVLQQGGLPRRYAEPDKGWTDRDEARWPMPFWHMDAAMASLLILQTAVDEGLGSCFFGIPPDTDAAVREAFGIPDDYDPVGVITIGHRDRGRRPATPASPARRRRHRRRLERRRPSRRWGVTTAGRRPPAARPGSTQARAHPRLARLPRRTVRRSRASRLDGTPGRIGLGLRTAPPDRRVRWPALIVPAVGAPLGVEPA